MIVVFGSQGQVGQALRQAMGEAPEHVFLSRESSDYCGDIGNTAGITETLLELRPNVVINAAAYTQVDQAESNPELAEKINAKAPAVMAQIAAKIHAIFVHYSTDYVFDGSGSTPWKETDPCHPLSVYGKTKYAAEQSILAAKGKHVIFRTSWVYSQHGQNFLKTMLTLAESRDSLRVVNDQFGVPTHADYLAETTLDFINLATPGFGSSSRKVPDWGIYHCAPQGETSWFDYARLVINTAKSFGKAQTCRTIEPVGTANYPSAAPRPRNSRLNTDKLRAALGKAPPNWQDNVMETVSQVIHAAAQDAEPLHDS